MSPDIDLTEELDRKSLDAVAQILLDLNQGAIAQPQAAYAMRILFMATSGLTGREAFDLVSKASAEIEGKRGIHKMRRFFVQGRNVVLLEYQFGESEVTIKRGLMDSSSSEVKWDRASVATFDTETNPFESASERFSGYATALIRAGYLEIL